MMFGTAQDAASDVTQALQIDSGQFLDFLANADENNDSMNKNPESDTEDAKLTVKLDGTTYEIALYETT
jgi:hypothetical protein